MHTQNMQTLVNHLKWLRDSGNQHKFDMQDYLIDPTTGQIGWNLAEFKANLPPGTVVSPHECNTVACIAGHAAMLSGLDERWSVRYNAAKWLGLDDREAHALFHGYWTDTPMREITLDAVIEELELRLDTELLRRAGAAR